MKTEIEITHFLDEDGIPLVSVPLTNSDQKVTLYQDDFNQLYSMGLDPRWRLSIGQVLERGKGRVSISRLVANANPGDKIQYLDRDPCNLRRENLLTASGAGKYKTRDVFDPMTRKNTFLKEKVSLKHIYINPSWANNEKEKELTNAD